MTKISNQQVYKPDTEIVGKDYIVGTDSNQAKKTVNFRIEDIGSHFNSVNGVRNFDFYFYAHQSVNPKPADGCFYSNGNEQDPNNITEFYFSKITQLGKDVSQFFQSIETENPFDLVIAQKIGVNSVIFFQIDNIEIFNGYYKLNVSEVFFPEGNGIEYILSYAIFNLKPIGNTSGNTDLGYIESPTQGTVTSSSGTNAVVPLADDTNAGLLSPQEKQKLLDIEEGAEVNNISDTNANELTSGGETVLHNHNGIYYTKTEVDSKLSAVFIYKGSVANYAALPSSGQEIGWTYNLLDTGDNYAWDGSGWDKLSGVVDISGKEDVSNKKTDLETNKTSNTFYASCKAIVDWVYNFFIPKAGITVSGRLMKFNFFSTGLKISSRSDGSEIGVKIDTDNLTADRTRAEQDKDGTYALLDDIDNITLEQARLNGNEINGDIQIEDDLNWSIGNNQGQIQIPDDYSGMTLKSFFPSGNVFAGLSEEAFSINSSIPTFKGFQGAFDFSANYDDLTYVQKKWVDDNFLKKNTGTTYNTNAIQTVTQAEYDASTKTAGTLYFIPQT